MWKVLLTLQPFNQKHNNTFKYEFLRNTNMADVLFYIGVLQLTVVFLSIAAGIIATTLFRISHEHELLKAWKTLIIVLVLFAIVEIIGVLDAFDIWRDINFLRHIIPSIMLGFLIVAIVKQIQITEARNGR